MNGRFPTTRDDAPEYLARYERRRAEQAASALPDDLDAPPYLARARARAKERVEFDRLAGLAPPERSEAFAYETTSPRELDVPEPFRRRLAGSTEVRLIRHGQTQGYVTDAALSDMGRWQAHRKGQDLAKGVRPGMTVRVLHAPTPRATETAVGVHEGLLQAIARYGIDGATVLEPAPAPEFDNFQVWCDGAEMDVTAAFNHFATVLDRYNSTAEGERPGWMVEIDRFWKVEAAGGDPITHWLTQPMQYFEPAALVVRRFWRGIVSYVAGGTPGERILVCTHSGPIRAVAASAVGHDPGEPYNVEDVRIRVFRDLDRAVLTYRGRGVELQIPTTVTPSWFAPTSDR
jgi:broad specificity phosphatase PhoE